MKTSENNTSLLTSLWYSLAAWERLSCCSNTKKADADVHCAILFCSDGKNDQAYPYVDFYLNCSEKESTIPARQAFSDQLDKIRDGAKSTAKRLVLLVDEAHHLITDDAFLFRCFRGWLCRNNHNIQVGAVFAGTSSQLANFYRETASSTVSRDSPGFYYSAGTRLYDPFYHIHTIGIFDDQPPGEEDTEFKRSARYGRPLFAC